MVLLIILAVILAFLPKIVGNNYFMTLINRVLIWYIAVLGLNFITGLTGENNLGMAGIFALGAYACGLATTKLGVSPWVGLMFSLGMGGIVGLALGYPSLRLKGIYLSLTTIGFGEVIRLLLVNLDGLTGGNTGVKGIPSLNIGSLVFDSENKRYYILLIFALFFLFCAYRLVNSKWGRIFKSLRDNSDSVEMIGVNIASMKILAFTICCIFGSVAGGLYSCYMTYINPSTFTFNFSANMFMMLMVGGLESVFGGIFGTIMVIALPEFFASFTTDYYLVITYIIVFVGAIVFPNGWPRAIIDGCKKLYSKISGKAIAKAGD